MRKDGDEAHDLRPFLLALAEVLVTPCIKKPWTIGETEQTYLTTGKLVRHIFSSLSQTTKNGYTDVFIMCCFGLPQVLLVEGVKRLVNALFFAHYDNVVSC
jgi:hypothetical protein